MANNNNNNNGIKADTILMVVGVAIAGYSLYKIYDGIRKKLGGLSKENEDAGITLNSWDINFWKECIKKYKYALVFAAETTTNLIKQLSEYQGWLHDDFGSVMSVIKTCKTQTQVSWLADKFQEKYKIDLYTFLKEGHTVLPWYPGQGLSDSHLTEINTYIKGLPIYKI